MNYIAQTDELGEHHFSADSMELAQREVERWASKKYQANSWVTASLTEYDFQHEKTGFCRFQFKAVRQV